MNVPPTVYRCSTNDAFDHTVIAGGDGGIWKSESVSGASTSFVRGGQQDSGTNCGKPSAFGGIPIPNTGPSQGNHSGLGGQTNAGSEGVPMPTCGRKSSGYGPNPGHMDALLMAPHPRVQGTVYSRTCSHIETLVQSTTRNSVSLPCLTICSTSVPISPISTLTKWVGRSVWGKFTPVKYCGYYEIKKANLLHTCCIETRSLFKQKASSRVIATVFKAKYGDPIKWPRAADLQQLVLEELRVAASYMKCYRAREGLSLLVTEKDDHGYDRFLYLFLSFGASIRGFRSLRHVIVIDGAHLGSKFQGTLLIASGQDANFQIDAACIVHLARNVTGRYKSKGLAKMVVSVAFAYRIGAFRKIYNDIRTASPDCARYLHKIGIAHWSRAHFPGERYNLMTSNATEQLNKALRGGRNSPILELLKFIQDMMTRWFNARRKKSQKHTGMCTPEVDKVLTANLEACKGSRINMVSSWAV
ncbi:unnamed protein product [Microthlaspi erraticum]|uniref:MULE transposase domain-containing protein n=1 Tax=Microthlaspi erraticum TaxID=1685480 RepID=A0A6D2I7Q3_9BRAS|nr:unnamed protein product [Microthlaspi erraticum]